MRPRKSEHSLAFRAIQTFAQNCPETFFGNPSP